MILTMLRELNTAATTIFLTTHNIEEANRLCNRVVAEIHSAFRRYLPSPRHCL